MPIVDTIHSKWTFTERAEKISPDTFSREAWDTLFEFYEELSDDTGENIEFDPVAFRCAWAEYTIEGAYEEFKAHYEDKVGENIDEEYEDLEEWIPALCEWLREDGLVREVRDCSDNLTGILHCQL